MYNSNQEISQYMYLVPRFIMLMWSKVGLTPTKINPLPQHNVYLYHILQMGICANSDIFLMDHKKK